MANNTVFKRLHSDLVVVSIPYYRCKEGIHKAVTSILSQTHKNLIVVVLNDGDPDPPWYELSKIQDSRLIQFSLRQNEGRYFADAMVIEAIDCPFYLMQDADDWSEPTRIACLLQQLKLTGVSGCVSSMNEFVSIDRKIEFKRTLTFTQFNTPINFQYRNRGCHCGLFKTSVLRSIGGYYGGFRFGYDTLLVNWLNMIDGIARVDKPLYNRLIRPESLSHCYATGMKSEARKKNNSKLELAYLTTLAAYRRKERGEINNDEFIGSIRKIRDSFVTVENRRRLELETRRLRQHLRDIGLEDLLYRPPWPSKKERVKPKQIKSMILTNRRALRVWEDANIAWTHWNISRWLANYLMTHLSDRRPQSILEVGSGISTLFLAAYAAQNKSKFICLDHDPVFYGQTSRLLKRFNLNKYVDLRLEPLVKLDTPAGSYQWYAVGFFGSFDFVFIDGPPKDEGRMGNLFAIAPHLTTKSEVWLHDANRKHEQACQELWKNYFKFKARHIPEDRGILMMQNIYALTHKNETF